jgi:hypothetical protein
MVVGADRSGARVAGDGFHETKGESAPINRYTKRLWFLPDVIINETFALTSSPKVTSKRVTSSSIETFALTSSPEVTSKRENQRNSFCMKF